MAKQRPQTVIRMGAGSFSLTLTEGSRTEHLDLTQAGRRKGVDVVRRGALMEDLGSVAKTVCQLHGIREKPLRGAKGKFLKRGRPWQRKPRREGAGYEAQA